MALDFNAVALETTEAKGGYGIGLQIRQQLLSSGMEVDAEAVAPGINDVLNQNPPAIDLKDVTKALQELGARAEAAQAEAFKAIEADNKAFLEENKKAKGVVVTESGLQYEVLTEGTGAKPTATSSVRVHYTGSLIDGTVFDSSVKPRYSGGIPGRRRDQRLDGSVTINDRRFKMAFNHPARVSIRRAWRRRINSSVCHLNF
ncbi:FKBP-type peptidyl-prolyl cis-trans isomerase 1 [Actinobacillus pleuropneumoniae serovar 3 str. JL03]|uniref:peptidylprolyl isomerase n=1 Tax=Actinobacillus pleuropneumoniae serotype 3 (strain JL03) TaxID=434271 RepID=B0BSD2_ACTPJ|nr:FKBP-type peptidyl-prolyl cis-trans isomerase 1 [Actinobacillus pleuropneumoniae serovar 3 str. JL03]